MKRDLGGLGLLSALLLNMVVWSISAVFWSVFSLDSEIAVIARFVCTSIWIVQFLYLIPIARHYRKKQQWEIVKGISVGAIVTIFINSTCYRLIPAGADDIPKIGAVVLTIAVMLITFYAFNRRSRPK
jgi:undecaprenyl pyrophosphate phosphatase UppP